MESDYTFRASFGAGKVKIENSNFAEMTKEGKAVLRKEARFIGYCYLCLDLSLLVHFIGGVKARGGYYVKL